MSAHPRPPRRPGSFFARDQGRTRQGRGPFSSSGGGAPKTLRPIIAANILKDARLFTDASGLSTKVGTASAGQWMTVHSAKESIRGIASTNAVEGSFSGFRRSIREVSQRCGKQHLHRYLAEFDFRYNNRVKLGVNDTERAERALRGVVGKRLTYERSH